MALLMMRKTDDMPEVLIFLIFLKVGMVLQIFMFLSHFIK